MKIIVIGGSIGGLSAGNALKCKGFDVEIYERSSAEMQDRGAGLVIQPDMMDYLIENNISTTQLFGVPATERQIINADGTVAYTYKNDTSFTSWKYIWKQLKDHFPEDKYFFGHELQHIEQGDNTVTVTFSNGIIKTADLLIGADGYNSITRSAFLPQIQPHYAGYISYRGLITEKDLTEKEVDFFENKFSICSLNNSHILSYMIPGPNGELTKGNRLFNWVWHTNKNNQQLDQILTDVNGNKRTYTVPPGFLSQESVNDLRHSADAEMPEIFRKMIYKTEKPFVQVILDLAVPKMFDRRIAIMGDAAFVIRPHTASGTAKAYRDAIALADSLYHHKQNIDNALQHWNLQQLREGNYLLNYGRQLAKNSGLGFSNH